MALDWNEHYATGIAPVDEEHKQLFRGVGDLALCLLKGATSKEVQSKLKSMTDLLREHMNREEELMFEVGCLPDVMIEHAKDHQLFLHHFYEACKEELTLDELRVFLRYMNFWTRYHVLTIDKPVCFQILAIQQGVSPKDAYLQSARVAERAMPILQAGMHKTYADLYDSQLRVVRQNSRLRETQNNLLQTNQELEDRVAQRTRELTAANNKLREDYMTLQHLNQQLDSTQGQLLQSDKMAAIGQLAAGVAHEINNPIGFVNANLSTLKSYITTLLDLINTYEQVADELPSSVQIRLSSYRQTIELDYVRQDVIELLAESAEGLDRVKQIVQDLKDFARAGEAVWQEADLLKGLDSTLNVVWNELKYKAKVHKEYGELPLVRCVPAQINQVFMNILVNAAHAIDKMGDIWLTSGRDGEWVWVQIRDNGKGMSEAVRTRIFEPFFTTKPVGQGTGLGLSLAYGILKKHKGRIEVTSAEGVGTTFTLYLPIAGPDSIEPDEVEPDSTE
jgi:two-component system, NtrC family, sensor kinase